MVIASLSGVGSLQGAQNVGNASTRLQAAISTIVSGQSADSANVSIATQLQSRTSALRAASNNIAQASSLTQVAEGSAQQIQNALIQLQSLAQQANSPILNSANRADLNQQFNQILASVNQLAQSTSFNGQNLLDGSLSGDTSLSLDSLLGTTTADNGSLSISDLTSGGLLSNIGDLLSADSAGQTLSSLGDALNLVISTRADIGSFQQTLNFASANIDSAINNQEAAQSQLSETDIAAASTRKAQDEVQLNAAIALVAQTNNLSPALLKLVG